MSPRNNAEKTRGKPFAPGNPGRPKGSRHKATVAAEALLDGEAEALTRKAVEMALSGDGVALRLCLERLIPARRDRPVQFDLPPLNGSADAMQAVVKVIEGVAGGEITPSEATAVAGLLESYRRALETTDIEARLAALEEKR